VGLTVVVGAAGAVVVVARMVVGGAWLAGACWKASWWSLVGQSSSARSWSWARAVPLRLVA
jgi:hypothetical protein